MNGVTSESVPNSAKLSTGNSANLGAFALASSPSISAVPTRRHLDEYLLRILLRYYRSGQRASVAQRVTIVSDDIEVLRRYWSISNEIAALARYVVQHRHEAQAHLTERRVYGDAIIRGRFDVRQTLIERVRSGYPTRVVFWEATKTFASDPNHVLAWVLYNSHYLARHFAREVESGSTATRASGIIIDLEAAKRIENISLMLAESRINVRPTTRAVSCAAKSRRPLYRLAAAAYQQLLLIERADKVTIAQVLRDTLIAPLETWRAFELAIALGAANALSRRLGDRVLLNPISPGASEILISVGPFAIAWQTKTASYQEPRPEPSELLSREICNYYGLREGDDRPDLVVIHSPSGRVVGLAEAKHFGSVEYGWRSAIRDAATQIVRYSRGYGADAEEWRAILSRSLIGIWAAPLDDLALSSDAPMALVVDFDDLDHDSETSRSRLADSDNRKKPSTLSVWADRIVSSI
jgi:hypothetical protein